MKFKRIISTLLIFLLACSPLQSLAIDRNADVYLCDGFGTYATYTHTPRNYTISDSTATKIVESGKKNKALLLLENNAVTVSRDTQKEFDGKFVYSLELKGTGKPVSADIGIMSDTNKISLVKLSNNVITMSDGKSSKALSLARGGRLSIVVDNTVGRLSVYADKGCVIDEWKMTAKNTSYNGIYITKDSGSGELLIDSVAVYKGTKVLSSVNDKSYSDEKELDLSIDQYPNNNTFFDSDYIVTASKKYLDSTISVSGAKNSYVGERLDYKNVEKGDRIILHKEDTDEKYNHITLSMGTTMASELYPETYYYKNYSLEGDFCMTTSTMGGFLMQLTDKSVNPAQELSMVSYASGGNIRIAGMGNVTKIEPNRWYHIAIYLDFNKHKGDLFLDGNLVVENFDISQSVKNISFAKTSVFEGKGDLQLRKWVFTGLKFPMEKQEKDGKIIPVVRRESQFPDDTVVKEYLTDKTVLHGDGNIIYKDSKKFSAADDMVFDNDNEELYVSPEDFNTALGSTITYSEETKKYSDGKNLYTAPAPMKNGEKILIPSCALSKALGYYAVYLEYGKMVMISKNDNLPINADDNRSWFDDTFYSEGDAGYALTKFTPVQEISNYIFYDRPTAAKLQEDFNKHTNNGQKRPRIALSPEMMDEVNEMRKTDEMFNNKVEEFIKKVDRDLESELVIPKYEYSDGLRTLKAAWAFRDTVIDKAFCYQLTKDEKYARPAIECALAVAAFPDYNPGHVIDIGTWMGPLSYVYDWCYDVMTKEERKTISDAIITKAIEVVNKAYYADLAASVCYFGSMGASHGHASFFPKWKSNFIPYTQGGIIQAALAVAEDAPEICFDTIEKALRSYEYSNFGFYSGGAWIEGKGYQAVVNNGLAYSMSACNLSLGDTYKILDYPGVKENLDVLMYLSSASGSFSYADDNFRDAFSGIDHTLSVYAKYYKDEKYAKWRQHMLGPNKPGTWADLAYYIPGTYSDKLEDLPTSTYTIGGEFFTVHEDWNDKNALFFGAAGGPTRHYHFHNDGGDFQFSMNGVRWCYDLGTGDYNVGTNYTRYGGRTEAHNTLTINPDENYSQAEQSFAEIIRHEEGEGGAYAVLDMTSLYAHHGADKVHRGYYIGDNFDTVTIRDEMKFNKSAKGYWFMTTEATPEQIDDNTILLSKEGKTLVLQYACEGANVKSNLSIMEAAPLPTSPKLENDNTAINPKLKKVAIYFEGSGDIAITVRMAEIPGKVDLTPISKWTAPTKTETVVDNFDYNIIYNGENLGSESVIYVPSAIDIKDFEIVVADPSKIVEIEKKFELEKPMRMIIRNPQTGVSKITSVKFSLDTDAALKTDYRIYKVEDFLVSDTPELANSGPNMFDRDFKTRWYGSDKGQYAQIDLGEVKQINAVAIGFWKGNERKYSFDVMVSEDGETFTKAASFASSGTSENYEIFEVPEVKGRYVRIVGQGNTANNVINIFEARVLQKK